MKTCDLLVVGGGVVGLTAAREAARRKMSVLLVEKEASLGFHTSGRNSGVLHAGLYYAPDSFKAKLCLRGNRLMREYAAKTGFKFRLCGKVVVAPTPEELPALEKLYARALANGVRVELIDEKRLAEIEPEARTAGKAIWSPDTGVFDPKDVMRHLEADAAALGADILPLTQLFEVDADRGRAKAGSEEISFGHLLNAAGLHADRVAKLVGVGENYRILPFKGLYKRIKPSAPSAGRIRGLIYSVPDPRVPFLGSQAMRTATDDVLIGPTAIPALGRENYGVFQGLEAKESFGMAKDLFRMFLKNQDGFRSLVFRETPRYTPWGFLAAARKLVPALRPGDLESFERIGLRAQLVDARTLQLVMDFVVERGPRSTHVLNAVSPAFTSSLAFAELLLDRIEGKRDTLTS